MHTSVGTSIFKGRKHLACISACDANECVEIMPLWLLTIRRQGV